MEKKASKAEPRSVAVMVKADKPKKIKIKYMKQTEDEWLNTQRFLELKFKTKEAEDYIEKFKEKEQEDDFKEFRPSDILRAAGYKNGGIMDRHVIKELQNLQDDKPICYVMLIKPKDPEDKLIIADGVHKVSALDILDPHCKVKAIIIKE
jgi:hypothetical protein